MNTFTASFEDYDLIVHDNTLSTPVKEWAVDAHVHSFYELHYVIKGSAILSVENESVRIESSDLIFINKDRLHYALSYEKDLQFISISFDLEKRNVKSESLFNYGTIKKYLYAMEDYAVLKDEVFAKVIGAFLSSTKNKTASQSLYFVISSVYINFLSKLFERMGERLADAPAERSSKYKNELIKIDKFVSERYMEDISIGDLAKTFYLSTRQMSRIFEDLIGESFHKYLLRQRMNVAVMHMRNGAQITELPFLCGFDSYSGFYVAFKNFFGLSPKKYKETMQKPIID